MIGSYVRKYARGKPIVSSFLLFNEKVKIQVDSFGNEKVEETNFKATNSVKTVTVITISWL